MTANNDNTNVNNSSWHDTGRACELDRFDRLRIWNATVPGNSNQPKTDVMDIQKGLYMNPIAGLLQFMSNIRGEKLKSNAKEVLDNYTYYLVRPADSEYQDTFTDQPYLIPFIAEGSSKVVIVVPGGGCCFKSMETEGVNIAKALQSQGITAFVLWYRSNPYYQPYPLMDMQRAVRYVRYHAQTYGYSPNQIGAVGFSAGGAQLTLFTNVLRAGAITIPEYEKDEIDGVDDQLNFVAPVYPALTYNHNMGMLYASFPKKLVRDKARRSEVIRLYDAVKNMNCKGIPHFICYGSKEDMVSIDDIKQYIVQLNLQKTPCKVVVVEGAGHGYGDATGTEHGFWLNEFIQWIQQVSNKK